MKPQTLLYCLMFALSANLFTAGKAQVNVNDSLALVDLYNSTNGPGWLHNDNWLTKQPVSTWWGVTVDSTRVKRLLLKYNNLTGMIPESIGNLRRLTFINLNGNMLTDTIPASIGKLVKMRGFSLAFNQLNGAIPNSIGRLNHLKALDLGYNQLSGAIPNSIGKLTRLEDLFLASNQLSGTIPSSIGNLVKVKVLALGKNQLSGKIPANLGNMLNATQIGLENNHLSGSIPVSFSNLHSLEFLLLGNNELSGSLPVNVSELSKLQYLELSNNQFSGSIPFSLGKLTAMQFLYLDNNHFSGNIPSSIGNLRGLQYLYLNNNELSGPIPASVGNLVNVYYCDFSYNKLSDNIPNVFESFIQLSELKLNNNELTGGLPKSFRKFKFLVTLNLSHNHLSQTGNFYFFKYDGYIVDFNTSYNNFTFDGLEFIATHFNSPVYSPQATISIHQKGNTLSVYAGGTLSNNTYRWFMIGKAGNTTIKGDSTFTPIQTGKYFVRVTNAAAGNLTLVSDTIDANVPTLTASNRTSAGGISKENVFHLSPNPASSIVNVQVNGTATIVLINGAGKVMLTKMITNKGEINVNNLSNGTYFIFNKNTGETQKFVIIH